MDTLCRIIFRAKDLCGSILGRHRAAKGKGVGGVGLNHAKEAHEGEGVGRRPVEGCLLVVLQRQELLGQGSGFRVQGSGLRVQG